MEAGAESLAVPAPLLLQVHLCYLAEVCAANNCAQVESCDVARLCDAALKGTSPFAHHAWLETCSPWSRGKCEGFASPVEHVDGFEDQPHCIDHCVANERVPRALERHQWHLAMGVQACMGP